MQDSIVIVGATSLGLLVGWMTGKVFVQLREFTPKAVTSILVVMGGAGVAVIFHLLNHSGLSSQAVWAYPIGLLVGFGACEIRAALERKKVARDHERDQIKITIENCLRIREYSIISFERLRRHTNEGWSDEFLKELIQFYPADFAPATPDHKPGLRWLRSTRITPGT